MTFRKLFHNKNIFHRESYRELDLQEPCRYWQNTTENN